MSILGKGRLKLITAPAVEPVSAADAKAHLRVDSADDDTLIAALIVAARQQVEAILNRALITQTWELVLDAFPGSTTIRLPRPPLQSVTSIKYKTEDGVESTFDSSKYVVDSDSEPGRIKLDDDESWPSDTLYEVNGVRIRYIAGYGDADDVPQAIKQAMLLLIGDWYENREATVIAQGFTSVALPVGVEALLMPYRIWEF